MVWLGSGVERERVVRCSASGSLLWLSSCCCFGLGVLFASRHGQAAAQDGGEEAERAGEEGQLEEDGEGEGPGSLGGSLGGRRRDLNIQPIKARRYIF